MSGPAGLDEGLRLVRARLSHSGEKVIDRAGSIADARSTVAWALREEGWSAGAADFAGLVRDITDHLVGLGPVEALLRRPGVTDVLVNRYDDIRAEINGRLVTTDLAFDSPDAVIAAVRRVVTAAGGRIDPARPFVDARLVDGSRLHAVIPPIAVDGPVVTLRRFAPRQLEWDQLVQSGSVPADAATVIRQAVAERRAIVVCGRTGAGKTTLLQRLMADVDDQQRIVLIEDAPELIPAGGHLVRLTARTANVEGVGEVSIADLVRQALRMRPDRIILGESRGVEIAAVLQALITGHEGCMTTVHATSGAQALLRMEGMALQAGLPLAAAQAQIASAIDVIVAMGRGPDGARGVVEIAAVDGDGRVPVARSIWTRERWVDRD